MGQLVRRVGVFGVALLAGVAISDAQNSGGSFLNVDASPQRARVFSDSLGTVGGFNTRGAASINRQGRDMLSIGNVSSSFLGNSPNFFRFSVGDFPFDGRLVRPADALLPSGVGRSPVARMSPFFRNVIANREELSYNSGLAEATEPEYPLGTVPPILAAPTTPLHPNRESPSKYHEFFGLQRAPAEQVGPVRQISSMSVELDRLTDRQVDQMLRNGLNAFKAATGKPDANSSESLSRSMTILNSVRALDRKSYVPCVLLLHATLEREQFVQAYNNLVELVRRHPNFFCESPDLAGYFGTPEFLQAQMRRIVRINETASSSYEAHVMSAYAAWVLGDVQRVRAALSQADKLSAGDPGRAELLATKRALEAWTFTASR